jgi:hypothetical protein
LLRTLAEGRRQLVFNFNFSTSNAARLPAFVLLVSRFIELVRQDKLAPEARNVELAEPLIVTTDPQKGAVTLHDTDGSAATTDAQALTNLRAPTLPGFFSVTQGDETLLSGAAQFADARESDFSTATTEDTLASHAARLIDVQTRADAWAPFWLVLLTALLIGSWAATTRRAA